VQWDASLYEQKHDFVAEYGRGLLDDVLEDPSQRVLDIGCGTGVLTSALSARAGEVVGIDLSEEMLARARAAYPALAFLHMDACALPGAWTDGFDLAFSNAAFHWIPDQPLLLQNVYRVLKPGGRLVCEFGAKGCVEAIRRAYAAAVVRRGFAYREMFFFPSPGEYRALLEREGFVVERITDFDRPTPLKGGESGLRDWMRQFFAAYLAALPGGVTEEVFREAEDALRPALWDGNQWIADYRRLRFVAGKPAGAV